MSGSDLPIAAREPAPASPLLKMLPHILRMLRREPAVAITIGYLLVAMTGIFYNYSFYAQFGIPVLTLSQVGDFLVTGVQQPMAILLVLSTLPVCWTMDYFNTRSRRKEALRLVSARQSGDTSIWMRMRIGFLSWRVEQLWFMQIMYFVVIVLYGSIFVSNYATYRADKARAGNVTQVRVWLNGQADALESKSPTWTYLGAVGNYLFVFDAAANRSVILPVNGIARIEPTETKAPSRQVLVAPIP
jgi:hypothetical protein